MLSNLMLAQAQYLFYKMATDKKMKPDILSKTAQQISTYFREAYSHSQMNGFLKKFQDGKFVNVLSYHAAYFEASAWLVLGIDRFSKAKEEGFGMGTAAGTASRAAMLFNSVDNLVKSLPDYKDNYTKKVAQVAQLSKMATEKASTVTFEKIPDWRSIQIPDAKNFVKFDSSASEELDKVPAMNEILRYIIPPQVRKMQAEFKE